MRGVWLTLGWLALAGAAHAQAQVAIAQPAPAEFPAAEAPSDRAGFIAVVRREAEARGLPPEIAEAVAYVESGFDPNAVGGVGEIGLMQIRPATAEMLGHSDGALALFDPATNARFAVRYLATAWKLADGDLCRALMKYRAGHGSEFMSPLSASYCQRARAYLARLGSPLADGVAPMPAMAVASPRFAAIGSLKKPPYPAWRPGRRSEADRARYWKAFEDRIKIVTLIAQRAREARIKAANLRLAKAGRKQGRS